MNWKNITLENGFIKQELQINGGQVVNYIPLNQVDSFGVVSSENKRWMYAGIFFAACALLMAFGQQFSPMMFMGMISAGLFLVYFSTRQTWFSITSSQTKFAVQVQTTKEELLAVNTFVGQIKYNICNFDSFADKKIA